MTIDGQKYYTKGAQYQILEISVDDEGYIWFGINYDETHYTWIREDFVTVFDEYF